MPENIHQIAADFLNDYLKKNGGSSAYLVVRKKSNRGEITPDLQSCAEKFVAGLENPIRHEVEDEPEQTLEPEQVILVRSLPRSAPYFHSFRRDGQPVFTWDKNLARGVHPDAAQEWLTALHKHGIVVTAILRGTC